MAIPFFARLRSSQFVRFVGVGGGCFLLNIALLFVGKEKLHLHYLLASTLALLIVSAVGFFLNRRITFARTENSIWQELGRYYTVNAGNYGLNLLLITLLVEYLKVYYLLANVLVGVVLMISNFYLHKKWSFASSRRTRED